VISGAVGGRTPVVETVEGITVHRVAWSARALARLWVAIPRLCAKLWSLRAEYDVVHVHSISRYGIAAVTFARVLGKPTLAKLPTVGVFGAPGVRASIFTRLQQKLLRGSTSVVAMSHDSVRELKDAGYPEARIFRITNGISVPEAAPAVRSGGQAPVRILFIGRISPEKGVPDLIAAWRVVVAECGASAHLTLCGSGPDEASVRQAVATSDLTSSITLLGHVEDVRPELERADVFVLPSLVEGNSNAIMEAMTVGLPVVSTAVGGTPLLVGPEGATYLSRPRDPSGLARNLLRAISNPDERRRVGAAMFLRVQQQFAMEQVAAQYLRGYEMLHAGHSESMHSISSPVFAEALGAPTELTPRFSGPPILQQAASAGGARIE
jgi:glycosyltransferase involved in cell wall biosynthesis